jgi:hypothetical protein
VRVRVCVCVCVCVCARVRGLCGRTPFALWAAAEIDFKVWLWESYTI